MKMANIFYKILLVFSILTLSLGQECPKKKVMICYWASWSVYRPELGAHSIYKIIPEYCTHLVYSFAGLNLNGDLSSLNPQQDITNGDYINFVRLKEKNPCVKILLAVGGWNEGSEKYSLIAESEEKRNKFADQALNFLIYFGFDGLDIDWEYPAARGGIPADKDNFIKLLDVLSKKLKQRKRILTVAVSASKAIYESAYDVKELCNRVDLLSIMGYDLHDINTTSIHSPLYLEDNQKSVNTNSLDIAVQYYVRNGCMTDKIVLGIAAYGRTYTLINEDDGNLGVPVKGPGIMGPYTKQVGFLGFNEICKMIKNDNSWQITFLKQSASNYAWKGDQWISYDDPQSVSLKAKYIVDKNLAGAMIWSIDTDDYYGECLQISYPLLSSINNVFQNH